jgi:arylsulfatase A-like enzyme
MECPRPRHGTAKVPRARRPHARPRAGFLRVTTPWIVAGAGLAAAFVFVLLPRQIARGANSDGPTRLFVLFDVDMLRADCLTPYGYPRATAPNLQRIFSDGLVANRAVASSGWTLPTHASIFTSQTVAQHGVRSPIQRLPRDIPVLGEILSAHGIRCLAVTGGGYLDGRYGFNRGFEKYSGLLEPVADAVSRSLELINGAGDGPVFLFLHTWQVHNYAATERGALGAFGATAPLGDAWNEPVSTIMKRGSPYSEVQRAIWLSARYDAAIRETDEALADFENGLRARGLWVSTALLFTSDHGEEIYDRPVSTHGSAPCRGHTLPYLYEEAVRIPLLLRVPWRPELRGRIDAPVSSVDIAPTVLDAFDIPSAPSMVGLPLGRIASAGPRERAVVSEAPPYGAVAVFDGGHKVITRPGFRQKQWETGDWLDVLPARECFDLAADPGERTAISCEAPWARELLTRANRYIASSFPGALMLRAEPLGHPCTIDIRAAGPPDIDFFGMPPGARSKHSKLGDHVELGGLQGPVWIAVQPRDGDRSIALSISGCGTVQSAAGKQMPRTSEVAWSEVLWRGANELPRGTILFSVAPEQLPAREEVGHWKEIQAQLRSLGYLSARPSQTSKPRSPAPGKMLSLPPAGRIRIAITP